jgi:L-asparaginase
LIESEYFNYDGFVIIMGTDAMAYAASALSFMLENLGKAVVFTGSQIPFAEVYNDARRNLIASVIFAASQELNEVCLFFKDTLLRGNRSTKVNSFGLDAFSSPNFPPLATLGVNVTLRKDLTLSPPKGAFRVHKEMLPNLGIIVVKLLPGFNDEPLTTMVKQSTTLKALILEMYGTGNYPVSKKKGLLDTLQIARSKGIIVIALSQCPRGSVLFTKYALGAALQKLGVLSGGDMTSEACSTKLAHLMGRRVHSHAEREKEREGEKEKEEGKKLEEEERKKNNNAQISLLLSVDLRGELSLLDKYSKDIFSGGKKENRSRL